MVIKPSKFVDQAGRVYLPYLSQWAYVSRLIWIKFYVMDFLIY